jgi:putative mRNA 3-end processing factor
MGDSPLIRQTPVGLYCEAGDFYVDPWRPVDRAVITHAHSDHARWGHKRYLTTNDGRQVLQTRLGDVAIDTLPYGESLSMNGVRLSLHPAGHVLGSAQIRIELDGEVWVVSGDYKTDLDRTCRPFELVRCHTFITESTFGLPIYRWPTQESVFQEINAWWRANRDEGRASIIYGYAFGKAQRVLAGLDPSIGPIYCHGAVERLNAAYRETGIELPDTQYAGRGDSTNKWAGACIVAPPSAAGTPWIRKFGDASDAFVSGWMLVRGARRRRAVDRGFPLSDHADWPGLHATIKGTGAERVLVTHGSIPTMVRWLTDQGLSAGSLHTEFEGEQDEAGAAEDEPASPIAEEQQMQS